MKRITNLMFVAIISLFAMLVSGCTEQQSSLDIEDIPTNAKITGALYYNAGYNYSNGQYLRLIKPAASKKVYVEVLHSSFDGSAQGYTSYETMTNENGEYEIVIPAVKGTSVRIIGETFIDTYQKVASVSNNVPTFEKTETVYTYTSELTVNPNDIKIKDGEYEADGRDIDNPNAYASKFIVKVGTPEYGKNREQYYDGSFSDYYVTTRQYKAAQGVNVIAVVNKTHRYAATTNSAGEATFIIPSEESNWNAAVDIEVESYVVNSFKYNKNEYDDEGNRIVTTYNIEGGKMSASASKTINFSGVKNDRTPKCVLGLTFTPFEDVETYGYSVSEWWNIDVEF